LSTKFKLGFLTLAIIIFAVSAVDAYTVDVSYNEEIGDYLVNDTGFTLYHYDEDEAKTSNLPVSSNWEPFYAGEISVPPKLDELDFDTITRYNDKQQTTYNYWPLYTYTGDEKKGDVNGNCLHVAEGWMYAISPNIEYPP